MSTTQLIITQALLAEQAKLQRRKESCLKKVANLIKLTPIGVFTSGVFNRSVRIETYKPMLINMSNVIDVRSGRKTWGNSVEYTVIELVNEEELLVKESVEEIHEMMRKK